MMVVLKPTGTPGSFVVLKYQIISISVSLSLILTHHTHTHTHTHTHIQTSIRIPLIFKPILYQIPLF